jgi:hypothetical protein
MSLRFVLEQVSRRLKTREAFLHVCLVHRSRVGVGQFDLQLTLERRSVGVQTAQKDEIGTCECAVKARLDFADAPIVRLAGYRFIAIPIELVPQRIESFLALLER